MKRKVYKSKQEKDTDLGIGLVAFLVISVLDLALRIPKEERMMVEAFGDAYEAYRQRTGSLIPR